MGTTYVNKKKTPFLFNFGVEGEDVDRLDVQWTISHICSWKCGGNKLTSGREKNGWKRRDRCETHIFSQVTKGGKGDEVIENKNGVE